MSENSTDDRKKEIIFLESDVETRLNNLAARLLDAQELLERAAKEDRKDAKLDAMFGAISAAVSFVRSFKEFEVSKLHSSLALIQSCLLDVRNGISPLLLEVPIPSNRDDWETRKFQFHCAVVMEGLIHTGMNRMAAAEHVASKFEKLDLKANTIADWRDKLIGRSDDYFASPFRKAQESFKMKPQMNDNDSKRAADVLAGYDLTLVNLRKRRRGAEKD